MKVYQVSRQLRWISRGPSAQVDAFELAVETPPPPPKTGRRGSVPVHATAADLAAPSPDPPRERAAADASSLVCAAASDSSTGAQDKEGNESPSQAPADVTPPRRRGRGSSGNMSLGMSRRRSSIYLPPSRWSLCLPNQTICCTDWKWPMGVPSSECMPIRQCPATEPYHVTVLPASNCNTVNAM